MQSHRNGPYLFHAIDLGKWKSAPDLKPCQLACKTLQFGCRNNTFKQQDKLIETTEWCNENNISFDQCASDTYTSNGDAKRFKQLIMEKTQAMQLLAN